MEDGFEFGDGEGIFFWVSCLLDCPKKKKKKKKKKEGKRRIKKEEAKRKKEKEQNSSPPSSVVRHRILIPMRSLTSVPELRSTPMNGPSISNKLALWRTRRT